MSATSTSPFHNSPRVESVSEEQSRKDFRSKLMDSWLVLRSFWVILNQWTKRNDRSFKWLPKTSHTVFSHQTKEILNVSQTSIAFQGFCHQFSFRLGCNNTAEVPSFTLRTALSPIPFCFWSVWCWRTMIPGKIFTSFAKFQGIVIGKDFWLPLGFQELLQAWIHWVGKSCTTTAYRWLFRDSQFSLTTLWSAVINSPKISARGTAPPLRLLHGALVILVLWQISQFRSSGKWL